MNRLEYLCVRARQAIRDLEGLPVDTCFNARIASHNGIINAWVDSFDPENEAFDGISDEDSLNAFEERIIEAESLIVWVVRAE